ncbi:hypothetical protein A2617_01670 [Candidatus Daviesbacteria bacterium RIFOXYD1_FULL_41_10]|uniref:Pyridoxamine 5'-phosphate oxidase N-terminal domain-containing protein n=2 Tax=Candidatus Daviesiibacteriota TaxID=1752718 RepID=A0A1F5MZJ2_9BACT|nr:MAG: hypothetical protein UU67_C0032G0012 [Candidatus Daviesbacteria bacterium GW2011_GWB1_41_5]OGE70774.1 MAG: hypothetical protein A2617_01670 [Candidatus Daviesbacteria bacterium RIFOXYD1_FULL_41_10]
MNMDWKEAFKKGTELTLATCSLDRKPNANIVLSLGFVDGKLLIADAKMETTIRNLQENNKICVVVKEGGEYFKIKGNVEIFESGRYFDICNESDKKYSTKHAILITIEEVFDLDEVKKIV